MKSMRWMGWSFISLMVTIGGCSDDSSGGSGGSGNANACDPVAQTGCFDGQSCEDVNGGEPACFEPVSLQGKVTEAATGKPIAGARIAARDANDAVVSEVSISAEDGSYSLRVPAPHNADGTLASTSYTLRADATGYLSFPKAPRVALPVDVATATGSPLVVASAATDITLIPLPDTAGLGSISGTVVADLPGGTLVVAGGVTGVADSTGAYAVLNVPAGSVDVRAYAAGLSFDSATANVTAGADTGGVDLHENGDPTWTVSGKLSIVDGGGASVTSVVLALEDTFQEDAARGEVPKGLRAANISGSWSISGVADGRYVVLAAFENDDLVRDPDTSIGGTDIPHIEIAGADLNLSDTFKVTGALAVISPGATTLEEVSGTPTLTWEDDSSEDSYDVSVFDALGNLTWSTSGNFDQGGSKPATVDYGGPALVSGMVYQFRAVSVKSGVPISSTEDLKGVFVYK